MSTQTPLNIFPPRTFLFEWESIGRGGRNIFPGSEKDKILASGENSSHPPSTENTWAKLYVKVHANPVALGQVNRLRVEETMYVALS